MMGMLMIVLKLSNGDVWVEDLEGCYNVSKSIW
jgi:hypothetical protein